MKNFINWKMFNFSLLEKLKDEKRGRGNPGHHFDFKYLSGINSFDLEDSKVEINDVKYGLVYLWTLNVCETNIIGRSLDEFVDCVDTMCEHIPDGKRIVVWVYNLPHEFQFLKDIFEMEDVFCPAPRQPIRALMNQKIELRDAWYLFEKKGLDEACAEMGIEGKIQGYDHEVLRTPETPLSDDEITYNVVDTIRTKQIVELKLQKHGDNLYTIPFTSTGYTREDVKKVRRELPWLSTLKPNFETHEKLEFVMNGGVAMSNKRKTNKKIKKKCKSRDMVSAYIFALCCLKFPMRPFKTYNQEVNGTFDRNEIERFKKMGRCWFGKIRLLNVKLKPDVFMEYIPEGKCTKKMNVESHCGRITKADFIEIWITDIDWKIIDELYDFDEYFEIDDVNFSKYDKLPEEITTLLKNLFADKTALKGGSDLSAYNHAKTKLNSVYGIMVQSLTRTQATFEEGEGFSSIDMHNEKSYKNKKMLLPYQWGVWCTAHTRKLLFEGVKACGESIVYVDTDCNIYEENEAVEAKLNELNEKRIKIAKENNAFAYDRNDNIHFMGVFEEDKEFEEFKTLGSKMYCGKVDGEIFLTCSGVNKKNGSKCLKSVDDFADGFEFDESCARTSTYIDLSKPIKWNNFNIYSSVVIEPYKFKIDLEKHITLEEYYETKDKIRN